MHQTKPLPAIYIPHGGGPAFFMQGKMHDIFQPMAAFLASIPAMLPVQPTAIVVISAHWEAPLVSITAGSQPDLIFDYYGFPEAMYALTYPAPAAPDIASRAAELLGDTGIECQLDTKHGWDHGVFIPLMVMYPNADIPVVAISLRSDLDPAAHAEIGRALAPLREQGVLLVGSGMSYHNLSRISNGKAASTAFDSWLDCALAGTEKQRRTQLNRWADAPSARAAHPREEHLLPLMVISAAGSDLPAKKVWQGNVGSSRVSSWLFN